jgi:hypothetical protein
MKSLSFKITFLVFSLLVVCFCWHTTVLARGVGSPFGDWPENWPKELEPFRERAESVIYGIVPGVVTQYYIIEFQTRDEFERVWPVVLRLKSKGAPLMLKTPDEPKTDPDDSRIVHDKPTLMIVCPPPDDDTRYELMPDGTYTLIAPWTKDFELPDGALPKHVVKRKKDGKWIAWDGRHSYDDYEAPARILQARVELRLYVDGEVVNLNRIRLPEDTPIIDARTIESTEATP